jgi:nucleoside-diphosphate-sugar epimerase
MKILVTGGAGFIGSHLVERLYKDGNEVIVLDNLSRGNKLDKDVLKEIKLIKADIREQSVVYKAAEQCDLIYHFAAVLGVDIVADNPVLTMETEAIGTLNVANAAILNGVKRIIYASTSGVYGKSAITEAVNEEYSVSPKSSYSIAKRFNEILLASYFQEKELSSVSLRFFNVYGPKQDERMVIPRFIQQALKNEPLTIYGNGMQTRDFTYIDDVIEACVKFCDYPHGAEIFNVSNEKEFSINDLAKFVVKKTQSKSEIHYLTPPENRYDFEVERRFGSSDKLFKKTGFKPDTDLEEGLSKIIGF